MEKWKAALIFLLLQLPVGGSVIGFGGRIQQDPVGSLILFLLYETCVLAVAFGGKIWSELEPEMVKASASWVRTASLNTFSRFRQKYNTQIAYQHRTFNVKGLRTQGTHKLNIEDVFVELRVIAQEPRNNHKPLLPARQREETGTIWQALKHCQHHQSGLVIIGPPGSGKTTLLQHVALTFAANRQNRHDLKARVPIMLFLRDHVAAITTPAPVNAGQPARPPSLAALTHQTMTSHESFPTPPPDWFKRELEAGRCIVLLDGLDEVADTHQRRAISEWVDDQIKIYPRNTFVISSRPEGYRAAPLSEVMVSEVLPFNGPQVERFIRKWYLVNEIMSRAGKQDKGIEQEAKKGADDLLMRLRTTPALNDMTRNPLLLTMIAMVHRYRGALPGQRVELYSEICDVLLGHWADAKGLHDPLNATQKKAILQPLAAWMMGKRQREIAEQQAITTIRPALKKSSFKRQASASAEQDFLAIVRDGSGLLQEVEQGRWAFAHLTFQEYLTASHWVDTGAPADWKPYVGESWWHETLRLYASLKDATALIAACCALRTGPAIHLLSQCLSEARTIDTDVRERAEQLLQQAWESDGELFSAAAEYLLNERIQRLNSTHEQVVVDTIPILWAEYQLFLNETEKFPEYWGSRRRFAAGAAQQPAVGMYCDDAEAFCTWLTERAGGTVVFRLPSLSEAQQDITTTAFWAREGDCYHVIALYPHVYSDVQQIAPTIIQIDRFWLLTRARDRAIARALARALDLDLARARALDLDLDLARARARARARALALARALDLDLDLARARDRERNIVLDLVLARARALDRARDLEEPVMEQRWSDARAAITNRRSASDAERRRNILLLHLIDVLEGEEGQDEQTAVEVWRNYGIALSKTLIEGAELLIKDAKRDKEQVKEYQQLLAELQSTHSWLMLTKLRAEGKIPAWEKIILVRSTAPDDVKRLSEQETF